MSRGYVGATAAYTVIVSGLARKLILLDLDTSKAERHTLDLAHASHLTALISVRPGDCADCRDADVILFCAGAAQRPGQGRLDLVEENLCCVTRSPS